MCKEMANRRKERVWGSRDMYMEKVRGQQEMRGNGDDQLRDWQAFLGCLQSRTLPMVFPQQVLAFPSLMQKMEVTEREQYEGGFNQSRSLDICIWCLAADNLNQKLFESLAP